MKKQPIQITKEELKEILVQYKKLWELIETLPKRKILTNYEKDWFQKKFEFTTKHKKIEKLFKSNHTT
ncbi:MAG: hypothetical protein ACK4UJ_01425 [Leptonema sp. (in: bacteria)]